MRTASTVSRKHDNRRTIQVVIYPGFPALLIDRKQYAKIFSEGDIQDFNQQFCEILNDLRKDVQKRGLKLSENTRDAYLLRLRDTGKAAYNKMLNRDARKRIRELEGQAHKRGICITFTTPPTLSFFWQMLYAGNPFGVEVDKFWGFRYPLGRTYWETEAPDRIRFQQGIFSAIHGKLQHSRNEIELLTEQVRIVCEHLKLKAIFQLLDHVMPASSCSQQPFEQLIQIFNDHEFRFGVVHFACHCHNPQNKGASHISLSLTAHQHKIESQLETLLAWEEYGFHHQPFVFLNACESATPGHLLQSLTLPTGILNFGAGGVIATACPLPDKFASAFAAKFYRCLLQEHSPNRLTNIGEALLKTRLYFLREYNNPLGLAYGLYAVSNQQLQLVDWGDDAR